MQVSALPASTMQRVASIKSTGGSSTLMTPTKSSAARSSSSPASSSNLSKASDASLRTSRQQLPTIAGSPSVGPVGAPPKVNHHAVHHDANGHSSLHAPSNMSLSNTFNGSMREKDTPTKIPRISGRTSATSSPQSTSRNPSSAMGSSRRMSLNNSSMSNVSSNNTEVPPSPQAASFVSDFGVLEQSELGTMKPGSSAPAASTARGLAPRSSPQSISRVPRGSGIPGSSQTSSKRPVPRESLSYTGGLRKSSITSLSTTAYDPSTKESIGTFISSNTTASQRLSALSPSRSIKAKMGLPAPRIISSANSSNLQSGSPSSSRQSFSTPSPVLGLVDEDELLGDEEMMAYIRRTQARKLASGARKEDLDEMLRFPEPLPPLPPSTPTCELLHPSFISLCP